MINSGDTQARDNLERVLDCLDMDKCETFQDCITWARLRTQQQAMKLSSGLLPSVFLAPSHLEFILAGSILRAETFGIPIPDWVKSPKKLADAINNMMVPDRHVYGVEGLNISRQEGQSPCSASCKC
ncbi:hypothetical protein ACFE04_010591 [Oxalis oulophora]